MAGKKEKKVKNKRPMAGWAIGVLKFTQHVSVCIAMLCLVAAVLLGSVYVEHYGGYRSVLQFSADSNEQKAEHYLKSSLQMDVRSAIQLATIRSQLETDGRFDLKKDINISEYYYRKDNSRDVSGNEMYFELAVYELEDLLRWEQAGGLQYLNAVAANSVDIDYVGDVYYDVVLTSEETDTTEVMPISEASMEVTDLDRVEIIMPNDIIKNVENMFLTVDGLRLEEIVSSNAEYQELCRQLASCMSQLNINYQQYQSYIKEFEEGSTSFVYYIDMDNAAGDVYTNLSSLNGSTKSKRESYFDNLVCSAAGTKSLYYDIDGNFEVSQSSIKEFISDYSYAFGNSAVVYAGYDFNLGVHDYYRTIWDGYVSYDTDNMYVLLGIIGGCAIYYVFVMLYLLYASGRKIDKNGEEYLELKWSDSIYTEVFLGWCVALGFGIAAAFCLMYEYFMRSPDDFISLTAVFIISAASFLFSMFTTGTMCSLSRRIKSGTVFKNSLIYKAMIVQLIRFGRLIGRKWNAFKYRLHYYVEHSGLWERTWGILLVEVVFYFMCLVLIWMCADQGQHLGAFGIGAVMILVMVITSFKRMRGKIERREIIERIEGIVAGESVRVEVDHLSLENAALGHAVNEIGEGIRVAVEQSTKDERLKAELLTNVSHDIKTPLTSIINYVDLLKKENIGNEKAAEYIEVLENKSLKLKNLIQDLIEVSKISTGNIEYEMVPLKLHELIMQAMGEYDERFSEHCLKVIYNNNAKDAVILADSRRIWRVIENLFSNVYKYALEGTRVYVEVTDKEDEVCFTIKNISAKEINIKADELTERFVRGDLSRTTEGSGLGLAIAQNLVLAQNGTFKILLDGDLFKVVICFKKYEA